MNLCLGYYKRLNLDTGEVGPPTTIMMLPTIKVQYNAASQDLWYGYDSMNRQTLVDGLSTNTDLTENNINAAQGHLIKYDYNGNRISDTFWDTRVIETRDQSIGFVIGGTASPPVSYSLRQGVNTEYYSYDSANRLSQVSQRSFDRNLNPLSEATTMIIDSRIYDGAGRVLRQGLPTVGPNAESMNNAATYNDVLNKALNENGSNNLTDDGALTLRTRTNQYDGNGRFIRRAFLAKAHRVNPGESPQAARVGVCSLH